MKNKHSWTVSPAIPSWGRERSSGAAAFGCLRPRVFQLVLALALGAALAGCSDGSPGTAEEYMTRAAALIEQGDYATARVVLLNAQQMDPQASAPRHMLGIAYLESGDAAAAVDQFQRAIDQGGDAARIVPTLAWALFELNRLDEIRALAAPQELGESEVGRFHALKAIAFATANEAEKAEAALAISQETPRGDESTVRALQALARARLALAAGMESEAGEFLTAAVEADPELSQGWSLLGQYHTMLNDQEAAVAAFGKAIETAGNPQPDRLRRAFARLDLGDTKGARADIAKLKRADANHPGVQLAEGIAHMQEERFQEARANFETALARYKDYNPALLGLGEAHLRLGNLEQAEHFLTRHLTRQPNSIQGIHGLVQLHVQKGRPETALALLDRASLEHTGDHAEIDELRARVLLLTGDTQGGVRAIRSALQSRPASAELQALLAVALVRDGNPDGGFQALGALAQMEGAPETSTSAYFTLLLQSGRYEEALELARRIQESDSDSAASYNFVGGALMGLGRFDEARQAFERGLALDPEHAGLAMNLADLERQTGRDAEARAALEAIQAVRPGHLRSARQLAFLELQAGNLNDAKRWLEKAVAANPDVLIAHQDLARIERELGDPRSALETLRSARTHHPKDPALRYAISNLHLQLEQPRHAVEQLAEATRLAPESAELRMALARAQVIHGDEAAAEQTLISLVENHPDHVLARLTLARGLIRQGLVEEAIPHVTHLTRIAPDHREVMALSGHLALRTDRASEAVTLYQKALQGGVLEREWVLGLAEAQQQIGESMDSIETVARWADAHPEDRQAWHLLGSKQAENGLASEALNSYEHILSIAPADPIALNNAAWLLRKQDGDKALEYARRAVENAPEVAEIILTLGSVLMHQGDIAGARDALGRAEALSPEHRGIQYLIAWADAEHGNEDDAKARLRNLLGSYAEFPERADAESLLERLEE